MKFAYSSTGSRSLILFRNRRVANASVVILFCIIFGFTTSILTWSWHTKNLFISFLSFLRPHRDSFKGGRHIFTSKTEGKVNKTRNPKKSKANSWQVPTRRCAFNQVVSTRKKNFLFPLPPHTQREHNKKAMKVLPHSAFNTMHFENRSRERQKTSLFINDQVPFIGPHII